MSGSAIIRPKFLLLPFADALVRNNVTRWWMGEGTGSIGENMPAQGVMRSLQVAGNSTAHVVNGTFTVTLYKDGVAAGNICFQLSYSITSVGQTFGSTDTSVGAGGANFSDSSDWFLKYDYTSTNSTLEVTALVTMELLG